MEPIKATVLNPGGITYYESGAGWGPCEEPPAQPKVDVWEWRFCESCRDSSHRHMHTTQGKLVQLVAEQIKQAIGEEIMDQLESWGAAPVYPHVGDCGRWPAGRIMVSVVRGTSEGWYIHVETKHEGKSECVILAKAFDPDLAWQVARKIADVLEV